MWSCYDLIHRCYFLQSIRRAHREHTARKPSHLTMTNTGKCTGEGLGARALPHTHSTHHTAPVSISVCYIHLARHTFSFGRLQALRQRERRRGGPFCARATGRSQRDLLRCADISRVLPFFMTRLVVNRCTSPWFFQPCTSP